MTSLLQEEGSLLHRAVEKGHANVVGNLVTHGANKNTLDNVRNLCMGLYFVICIYNFKKCNYIR